jgi:hypothetical protein
MCSDLISKGSIPIKPAPAPPRKELFDAIHPSVIIFFLSAHQTVTKSQETKPNNHSTLSPILLRNLQSAHAYRNQLFSTQYCTFDIEIPKENLTQSTFLPTLTTLPLLLVTSQITNSNPRLELPESSKSCRSICCLALLVLIAMMNRSVVILLRVPISVSCLSP